MQNAQDNINDWLLHEAHMVTGHTFQMDDCSCLPVWPDNGVDEKGKTPQGFLVTHGSEVAYQDAHTPEGEQMLGTWSKCRVMELLEQESLLPAEYWYG